MDNQNLINLRPVATEEQNRLFIEYAPAAMAMFNKEMTYISVSRRWMKEYDLTGNIIGRKHYELFPNILQRWKDVHARCIAGAIEKSDGDFYVKDNGNPVWLKWEVYPWYTPSNEIGGIVIFTENITERTISQQAIKENEERFRAMAEEAPLLVWETDEKLQTIFLNKTGIQYFNLEKEAKINELSWKKYIHPGDLEMLLKTMTEAAHNHESYRLEMRLKNGATGEYRWFLDNGSPRYKDEKFVGFVGTSLDIHDRKEAEQLLEIKIKKRTEELHQKNEELRESIRRLRSQESKDEQKNNFIAMASHELRTPITSIKGYVQVLLSAFDKKKDENKSLPPLMVRSSLISVDKQVNRLTRLIAELLDLSRIESGTLEMKKEKFSLNELAIDTIEDIRYTNASHQINLYHDFHGYVYADKDRIGQAMINFLTNAIKYSPGSTKVDVTISQPAKGEIAYSVRDYGIGIDKTEHEKVFERFYRAEGKKEQTYPGFGIGLFIVSEFIQKHSGRVHMESEKGKGSLFTFILAACPD